VIRFLAIFSMLIGFAGAPHAADNEEILASITTLNEASIEWLGISLDALSYLLQSGDGSYVPKDYVESANRIPLIRELEGAGFVTVEERVGLPDGQEPNETFIRLRPTKQGLAVIASIRLIGREQESD